MTSVTERSPTFLVVGLLVLASCDPFRGREEGLLDLPPEVLLAEQLRAVEHAAPLFADFGLPETSCTAPGWLDVYPAAATRRWGAPFTTEILATVRTSSTFPVNAGRRVVHADNSDVGSPAEPEKRLLLFVQPLESEAGLQCSGLRADNLIFIVGWIQPSVWQRAGLTEDEVFDRAEANVAAAGLHTATDFDLSYECPTDEPETPCLDAIPPPGE